MYRNHTRVLEKYRHPTCLAPQSSQYFCEACAAYMPADDAEWRRHATSEAHLLQLDSLQTYGVLGHMPDEGFAKCSSAKLSV